MKIYVVREDLCDNEGNGDSFFTYFLHEADAAALAKERNTDGWSHTATYSEERVYGSLTEHEQVDDLLWANT